MARKKKKVARAKKKPSSRRRTLRRAVDRTAENTLSLHGDVQQLKSQMQFLIQKFTESEEKVQDLEIHLNLLTRLLTTLCVEKFGMRVGVLKRIIKRIEKEAIRDSQIHHLENLYKMTSPSNKKGPHPKGDPWEEIS